MVAHAGGHFNHDGKLSALLPHNQGREGFQPPHHGSVNLGGGHSSSHRSFVKESVRHAIHARRALSHNPIISHEDLAPRNIQFKLTPEEEEKRKVRREKNKMAASKCRTKKREQVTNTKKDYEKVTLSNSHLEREIERLKQERQTLQQSLSQHQCSMSSPSSGSGVIGFSSYNQYNKRDERGGGSSSRDQRDDGQGGFRRLF